MLQRTTVYYAVLTLSCTRLHGWSLLVPFHLLLVRVAGTQNRNLIERLADELQGDRQIVLRKSARHGQRRQSGQVKRSVIFRSDMLVQCVDRPHIFDPRRRASLVRQREAIDRS